MSVRSSRLPSILVLLLLTALSCLSQTPTDTPYTLHLYEDLIQIPVLVVDKQYHLKAGLQNSDFFISLDSGPAFHPRKTHLEGDDPLSVVFLLDASTSDQRDFLSALQNQLARLPLDTFRTQDHLSVYAFACKFVGSAQDQPASNATLQKAVADILADPALDPESHQPCPRTTYLWDAINGAAVLSKSMPGRHVMIVLSPGRDHVGHRKHSVRGWETVRRNVASLGFTLIGVRSAEGRIGSPEDPFSMICSGTGGIDAYTTSSTADQTLTTLFNLIRGRYVVEFPRPANSTIGIHHLDVNTVDPSLVVRSGGDSAPILDNTTLPDPSLAPDAAPRPTLGNRRPMDNKFPNPR